MSVKCPKCKNDIWQVIGDAAECSNCLYTRPFNRRSGHSGEMTPSQIGAIKKIKNYFSDYGGKEIYSCEITFQDETGFVYVSLNTTNRLWTNRGGHFCIKRRGAIHVLSTYEVGLDRKETMKHYAYMLGGKVDW